MIKITNTGRWNLWAVSASTLWIAAAVAAGFGRAQLATSLLAGGAWHLASLWCLVRLLSAWTGAKRWPAVGWCLVKFPLLYLGVFALLRLPGLSAVGFGVGFSLVLVCAIVWLMTQAGRMARAEG